MEYIGVGRRAIAIVIDSIVLSFVYLGIFAATGDVTSTGGDGTFELQASGGGLTTLLIVLFGFGYFIVLEKVLAATLGKLVVGIRVVMADGSALTWGASAGRNLLRIVDGLFVYLVGAIAVWNSPTRQRIGDRAAGTVVVGRASVGAAPVIPTPSTPSIPPPPPPPPV